MFAQLHSAAAGKLVRAHTITGVPHTPFWSIHCTLNAAQYTAAVTFNPVRSYVGYPKPRCALSSAITLVYHGSSVDRIARMYVA